MWPHEPDDFESLIQLPEGAGQDDPVYFVVVEAGGHSARGRFMVLR
jgi:hypothetical protein